MSVLFKAEKREKTGSAAAKKIKRSGYVPAVIYSDSGNVNLSLNGKEFEREYFKGKILASVIEIELEGKKTKVIAHKVELDPVSDRPIHIDFLNCETSKPLRAKPKLLFLNQEKAPGLKKGGFLHVVLRKVEVICENHTLIPQQIELDIGAMQVGHKIRANNIKLPTGTKLAKKSNFLIASIIGRGKAGEEQGATTAETASSNSSSGTSTNASAAAQASKPDADKKPVAKK